MYNVHKALELLSVKHICPCCGEALALCEEPDTSFADGLGWGGFLYICFNDACKNLFTSKEFKEKYSNSVFTRYTILPGEKRGFSIPVYSLDAYKQLEIVEDLVVKTELNRLERIMKRNEAEAIEANLKYKESRKKILEFVNRYIYKQ